MEKGEKNTSVINVLCQMVHEQVQHLPVFLREPMNEAVDLRHPGLLIL